VTVDEVGICIGRANINHPLCDACRSTIRQRHRAPTQQRDARHLRHREQRFERFATRRATGTEHHHRQRFRHDLPSAPRLFAKDIA